VATATTATRWTRRKFHTETWGKLWNARAYNAFSEMPSMGHKGILTEQQIPHVMALLLDPNSPVNI